MKFYSTNVSCDLHTYTVNGGEYQSGVDIDKVARAFAKFVQIPYGNVLSLLEYYTNPADSLLNDRERQKLLSHWTPSEERMLNDLLFFMDYNIAFLKSDGENMTSRVFHCCDLNSGRNFTWISSIC